MFTLKKKIGTPSIKIRNTFKLKNIYIFVILSNIYIFVLLSSKKKKPKKKICNRAKQWTASPTSNPRQAQQTTEEANPQFSKKKQKQKKKKPIQSKLVH